MLALTVLSGLIMVAQAALTAFSFRYGQKHSSLLPNVSKQQYTDTLKLSRSKEVASLVRRFVIFCVLVLLTWQGVIAWLADLVEAVAGIIMGMLQLATYTSPNSAEKAYVLGRILEKVFEGVQPLLEGTLFLLIMLLVLRWSQKSSNLLLRLGAKKSRAESRKTQKAQKAPSKTLAGKLVFSCVAFLMVMTTVADFARQVGLGELAFSIGRSPDPITVWTAALASSWWWLPMAYFLLMLWVKHWCRIFRKRRKSVLMIEDHRVSGVIEQSANQIGFPLGEILIAEDRQKEPTAKGLSLSYVGKERDVLIHQDALFGADIQVISCLFFRQAYLTRRLHHYVAVLLTCCTVAAMLLACQWVVSHTEMIHNLGFYSDQTYAAAFLIYGVFVVIGPFLTVITNAYLRKLERAADHFAAGQTSLQTWQDAVQPESQLLCHHPLYVIATQPTSPLAERVESVQRAEASYTLSRPWL